MISFLNGAAIVSIGLMIGVEFAVWVFINPILWKLEEPTRSYAIRLFAKKLGTAMPFWYAGNLLALLADAVLLRNQPNSLAHGRCSGNLDSGNHLDAFVSCTDQQSTCPTRVSDVCRSGT